MESKEKISSILDKYNFWGENDIEYGHLRPTYLTQIERFLDNSLIKVILGQRRCGKSRLMRMTMKHLIDHYHVLNKNILYINRELLAFDFIKTDKDLVEVFHLYQAMHRPSGKIYFFIDEIQEIQRWEKAINSLSQDYSLSIELFISGSNAHLLSGELATYLGGRYLALTVFPFSYTEYCDVFSFSKGKTSVLKYLEEGGLPETLQFTQPDSKQNYVQNLIDSIVLRDIVQRHKVRDVDLLEKLLRFVMDSVGSMLSVSSIIKTLSQSGYRSNAETIGNYLNYLQQTFLIHECARYDLRGKQILIGERKYYINDSAFRTCSASKFEPHVSRLLENIVYLALLRQGYQVYVGRYENKEVDFVAEKSGEKLYVQVAYLLADENVIQREFGSLALIRDNYPKWVVSLDEIKLGNQEGILHKPLWEVL